MVLVDSFQVQIFQTTSLSTADAGVWNITVPSWYIIKLSFLYFKLEPYQYSPCYYDAPGARGVSSLSLFVRNSDARESSVVLWR